MEQHPIPRQITTFEFKLIGFMTLRQFIYLVIFIPLGFIVYFLFPIPLLNVVFGAMVGGAGFIFAFVPIYDRPLDAWIKNLLRQLTKPTQYFFSKNNPPIYYLSDLVFVSDPHRTAAHIESQKKLAAYLAQKTNKTKPSETTVGRKNLINSLFKKPVVLGKSKKPIESQTKPQTAQEPSVPDKKLPFFTGIVKNHKLIPLPGILIYVKDKDSQTVRLLKTNPHGIFATFNSLSGGDYNFEPKDPNNNYFFDTINFKIEPVNDKPFEIYSKELI